MCNISQEAPFFPFSSSSSTKKKESSFVSAVFVLLFFSFDFYFIFGKGPSISTDLHTAAKGRNLSRKTTEAHRNWLYNTYFALHQIRAKSSERRSASSSSVSAQADAFSSFGFASFFLGLWNAPGAKVPSRLRAE